jgi:hypothetical protein
MLYKGIGAYPWEALCSIHYLAVEALGGEKHAPK